MNQPLIKDSYFEFYGGPVKSCRKEHLESTDATTFTRVRYANYLFFHVPNEGAIPPQYRQKLIEAGLLKGVSDFIFIQPFGDYPGAAIEMKRQGKSQSSPVSPEQVAFLRACRERGWFTAVTYGSDQFEICLRYLSSL